MGILKLKINGQTLNIPFTGEVLLADVLANAGVSVAQCGGNGKCGKCAVSVSGCISPKTNSEIKAKTRLACQTRLLGDAVAEISVSEKEFAYVEAKIGNIIPKPVLWDYAAAVDVGTTTVALKLFNKFGKEIAFASSVNPQRAVSSDVMGRINASINGKGELLQKQIVACISKLLSLAAKDACISEKQINSIIITGNTTMLYLLCGMDVKPLSVYPFKVEMLFGKHINEPFNAFIPPCMNAFVGGDITCGVIASGMCESQQTALLCDVGTNGEIALWKNGILYVTSAAAGPAFEGASISCGCGSVAGAIDKVFVENGGIKIHTLGNEPPKGLCGSGLIDAVSVFLDLGYIDESGKISSSLKISDNVFVNQEDIRAFQLAKSAICSAIKVLLAETQTDFDEINSFYLSGGFGNSISVESAVNVGLFPKELACKAKAIGNGALHGAALMLFDDSLAEKYKEITEQSKHILLGGNEMFNNEFIKNIQFI